MGKSSTEQVKEKTIDIPSLIADEERFNEVLEELKKEKPNLPDEVICQLRLYAFPPKKTDS